MEETLESMPILRQLLINYVLYQYEEEAQTDNTSLVAEYIALRDGNELHLLFTQELLDNTRSLEGGDWL